jgi:hypothetical protein
VREGEDVTVEREMVAAFRAGERAARDRARWDSNPHRGTGPTARERVLAMMWRRGYQLVTDERLPADFPR